ncbi:hypothetical protein Pmani_000161 [Petrolisthes manimaculis]|uniref:Uncharacterized protein n=1 Tax=Petrolisthes manimaculis TaxID=1843537 RepID=A0AAE1UTA4_9EUCA|nr:hypothetical protein Pmani_000161 [Petrolisthes manimaculis]
MPTKSPTPVGITSLPTTPATRHTLANTPQQWQNPNLCTYYQRFGHAVRICHPSFALLPDKLRETNKAVARQRPPCYRPLNDIQLRASQQHTYAPAAPSSRTIYYQLQHCH